MFDVGDLVKCTCPMAGDEPSIVGQIFEVTSVNRFGVTVIKDGRRSYPLLNEQIVAVAPPVANELPSPSDSDLIDAPRYIIQIPDALHVPDYELEERSAIQSEPPATEHPCVCPIVVLLQQGCQCGGK